MASPPTPPATPPRRTHPSSPRRPSQRAVLIIFALLCAVALTVFAVRSSARSATNAPGGSAERGQLVYATRCASCHGAALQGELGWPEPRANGTMPAPPLGERGNAWRQTDQWLFATIKQGGQANAAPGRVSTMPAFAGGLPDDDIWATIAYIKSTWPSQLREAQPKSASE